MNAAAARYRVLFSGCWTVWSTEREMRHQRTLTPRLETDSWIGTVAQEIRMPRAAFSMAPAATLTAVAPSGASIRRRSVAPAADGEAITHTKPLKCQMIAKIAAPIISEHAMDAVAGIVRRAAGWRKGAKFMA